MPLCALMSSMPSRVSLVNLQKFTLKPWTGAAEHEDVGAGAEDARLEAGEDDGMHLGMLEAEALQRVGELDVHAEVVGVELQLVVVGAQAGVFLHVHGERGDRAVERSASSACTAPARSRTMTRWGLGRCCSTAAESSLRFKRSFKSSAL